MTGELSMQKGYHDGPYGQLPCPVMQFPFLIYYGDDCMLFCSHI